MDSPLLPGDRLICIVLLLNGIIKTIFMTIGSNKIKELFEKHTTGTASPEEVKHLFQLIRDEKFDEQIKSSLLEKFQSAEIDNDYDSNRWNNVFDRIKTEAAFWEPKDHLPKKRHFLQRAGIAASIVFCFAIGGYLFQQKTEQQAKNPKVHYDISPGKTEATLTLANGKKIKLSDAKSGVLEDMQGVKITKTANGQIVYQIKGKGDRSNKTNILETGKGQTCRVLLPDGTEIWLNAASSLKYPETFDAASQRRVTLSGEAFFQVAKDPAHPFIVKTALQEVRVLGTHFNINSYSNEPATTTTLLEGSVLVSSLKLGQKVLRPGEQSILNTERIQVESADVDETTAWKNGEFIFSGYDFRTVMRKIERWYNIEVIYEPSAPTNLQLGGFSSRSRNISTVLKMIAKTGEVHFRIEGRKVFVSK